MNSTNDPSPKTAKVEINAELLTQLITQGVLHINHFKCLDANAKMVIWHSFLNTSLSPLE